MSTKSKVDDGYKVTRKRVASLRPSPENAVLYEADSQDEIEQLAASIDGNGLREALVVTADNRIVSGHRRYLALRHLGRQFVPCRVLPRERESWTDDEFTALLRDYNLHRHKSVVEQIREELLDLDPDQALYRLGRQQDKSVRAPEYNGIACVEIEGVKKRYEIDEDKAGHVKYVLQVVFEDLRDYWPLTIRRVHYALLNYSFIRGYLWPHQGRPGYGSRQTLWYRNDAKCYLASSNLITRLRLDGRIPWEAFDDFTRPMEQFYPYKNVQEFTREEMDNLLEGYRRDLLQSQPNYLEVICEKNSFYYDVLGVTKRYQIPTSSGRGFNSIDPWHDLFERFQASGKECLIVVILSDFDPEGEMIPQVAGRTLLDDFGVAPDRLKIIKAGVTKEQIKKYKPEPNPVKESSKLWEWFVERNNGDKSVYELEALPPEDLLADLDSDIRKMIDVDLFNKEVAVEKEELARLESLRTDAVEAIKGLVG
jgi:hypothetical protein